MRIAQVCHNYLPHIGGIEFYIRRLVCSLNDEGIFSEVLTTDFRTPSHGRKKEAKYFKTSFVFMRNPFSWEFLMHFKRNSYDIFHVHNVWFLPCLIAVFFRKKARIILTMHGVYPDNSSLQLKIFLHLYMPFARYIIKKAEQVIVLSNGEKEKLKAIFNVPSDKIRVIHNGINIEEYKEQKRENVILFTGRITQDKNPDLLLKAISLLHHQLEDYKIIFIGPVKENYQKYLIQLARKTGIKNEIQFIGPLDQSNAEEKEDLMHHYRKARIFISIGSWEGVATRVMEAMQFKTPVISYAAAGSTELVTDHKNGLVLEVLDEHILARKIERILFNESFANQLGEEARKTIERSFDWEIIFKEILEIYKS